MIIIHCYHGEREGRGAGRTYRQAATRDSVAVVFQAFHRYAGVAMDEHLGYIFTSAWTILVCMAIIATDRINPLLGWLGILPAIGVLTGVFEEIGFKAAGAINALSYIFWSIWLIAFGVALLLRECLTITSTCATAFYEASVLLRNVFPHQ